MDWFLNSMWLPIILGLLFGCFAFEQRAYENLVSAIGWIILSAICGTIAALFGFTFMGKVAVFFFVTGVLNFLVMSWQDD